MEIRFSFLAALMVLRIVGCGEKCHQAIRLQTSGVGSKLVAAGPKRDDAASAVHSPTVLAPLQAAARPPRWRRVRSLFSRTVLIARNPTNSGRVSSRQSKWYRCR